MEAAEEMPNFRVAGASSLRPVRGTRRVGGWFSAASEQAKSHRRCVSSARPPSERARKGRRRRECLEDQEKQHIVHKW